MPMEIRWKQTSRDFNRFLQKFRRLHNHKVQYLRVVEKHKDGYPHIHALLQFTNAELRITANRYFDRKLYKTWRTLWTHGHSDLQQPQKTRTGTISYILKYLIKNTTWKTIWKKVLTSQHTTGKTSMRTTQTIYPLVKKEAVTLHGIKLCTWSRNFDWKPFMVEN